MRDGVAPAPGDLMNSSRPQPALDKKPVQSVPPHEAAGVRRAEPSPALGAEFGSERKLSGYGLPCIKCHLYYPADLDRCPTCKSTERVPPVVTAVRPNLAAAESEHVPDSTVVDQEREEF